MDAGVIDCEPDAVIYKGMQPGVTPAQLREALKVNTAEAVVPLLVTVAVKPGECHYLPSGTCHALGRGVLAAEVQTPSDTTFRVFDWGRTGRELHVDKAIENLTFGPCDASRYEPDATLQGQYGPIRRLVSCEYFRMDEVKLSAGFEQAVSYRQPTLWMIIAGGGAIACDGAGVTQVSEGRTVLLPPGMKGARLTLSADTTLIEVTFPQAEPVRSA